MLYKCCSFIIISIDLVFGWFQDSYTGIEQETDHVVMAGYKKGAQKVGHNLVFTINERSELIVNKVTYNHHDDTLIMPKILQLL